jgi:triacylglycerol lipase
MGREIYINRKGKISRIHQWLRFHDRLRGFLTSLRHGKIDYFCDHSMKEYMRIIRELYASEQLGERIRTPRSLR